MEKHNFIVMHLTDLIMPLPWINDKENYIFVTLNALHYEDLKLHLVYYLKFG